MQSVSEAIDMCLASHASWKQRLRAAADARSADMNVAEAANDNACEFGRWLDRDAHALSELEKGGDLELVRRLHEEFHLTAGETLSAALRGDRARYEASIALGGGFARASIALISAVTAWKGRVAARR